MESLAFFALQWIAIVFLAFMLVLALFEPSLPYKVTAIPSEPLDSPGFQRLLASLAGSHGHDALQGRGPDERRGLLRGGARGHPAGAPQREPGGVHLPEGRGHPPLPGSAHRARPRGRARQPGAGRDRRVHDLGRDYFAELRAAGGRVYFYHPITWYTLPRINNRTHRELIVIDGSVGFVGGAGFADHWLLPHGRKKRRAGATPCSAWRAGSSATCSRCSRRTGSSPRASCSTESGYFPPLEDARRRRGDGGLQHAHHRTLGAQPHGLPDAAGVGARDDRDHDALLPARPQRLQRDGARDPRARRRRHHPRRRGSTPTTC